MSYMSGIMMGWAIGKGLRRFASGQGGFSLPSKTGRGAHGTWASHELSGRSPLDLLRESSVGRKLLGSAPVAFRLAHALPGRRRYYAAALQGDEALAARLSARLLAEEGVERAEVNPVTGSLLLVYRAAEAAVDALMERAAREMEPPSPSLPRPLETQVGLAAVGQRLRRAVEALNARVKAATRGLLDLPSIFSVVFLLQGVQKMLLLKQLPSGPQLLWWAFSLLRGWRIA